MPHPSSSPLVRYVVGGADPDFQLESGHAILTLYYTDKQLIDYLRRGLKSFEIVACRGDLPHVLCHYGPGRETNEIHLTPEVAESAGLYRPETTIVSLSLWAAGPFGRKKLCERPTTFRRKINDPAQPMHMNSLPAAQAVSYHFTRSQVESGDFSHFLELNGPEKFTDPRRLRQFMGKLTWEVGGYDDDPREVWEIPEVRRFFQAIHAAWPYWLYFCDLDNQFFASHAYCCLATVNTMRVTGCPVIQFDYFPRELCEFIRAESDAFDDVCARAELTEQAQDDRLKAVFEYFKLPFPLNATPAR